MTNETSINYKRIEKAINYIHQNFRKQPCLDDIAAAVHLSPFHFQKLFSEWAGVSPKKFIQYLSVEYAKELLKNREKSLSDTAWETGLSGTGRLHDLFVNIESMTPGEYKNSGAGLTINYSFAESLFGKLIIASTQKGVCYIAFDENEARALHNLQLKFPNAVFQQAVDSHQNDALTLFDKTRNHRTNIQLHLAGTPFQLKVWESLLRIPLGALSTYGNIANEIGKPNSSRAVGTAIGNNPIAYIIPCHRVIKSTGNIGEYAWGSTRKSAMIGWEAACVNPNVA